MLKVVVDDKIPLIRGVLESAGCAVDYLPGARIGAAEVRAADALVVRTRTRCDAALLADSQVRFIATATIGFDHLDSAYLKERQIAWCNAPGCNADSVAGYLASVLVTLQQCGKLDLSRATLGVVGVGQVGSRVAALGQKLGMRVLRNDPPRRDRGDAGELCTLAELQQMADVVTLHVPRVRTGCYATENLIDAAFLAGLRPGAWLVNTSRGEVVEEAALKTALRSGRLGGAVLDVWRNEPEIDLELLALLFGGTPHIAGYSADGKANGTAQAVNAVSRFFHLGLDDWYPAQLPPPATPVIVLPEEAKLFHAVTAAYDFRRDDAALRRAPEQFESYRGDYPLRREFPAYTVKNAGSAAALLEQLGFQVDV